MPTLPSKIAHFEIVRVIGEGGMSFVYQGHNPEYPEYPVDKAIKTIRTARHTADDVDELERRFTAEAKVGAIPMPLS